MNQRLHLYLLIIIHGVANKVRKVRFVMRNYAYMMAGDIAFLFVSHTSAVAEKLHVKVGLWDKVLRVNVCLSMAESSKLLAIDSGPCHVHWVMLEAASEGLSVLLTTL